MWLRAVILRGFAWVLYRNMKNNCWIREYAVWDPFEINFLTLACECKHTLAIYISFFRDWRISCHVPFDSPLGDLTFRVILILLDLFDIYIINMFASMYFQDYIPFMPNDYLGV